MLSQIFSSSSFSQNVVLSAYEETQEDRKQYLWFSFSIALHCWEYKNSSCRLETLFQEIMIHYNLIVLEQMEKVENFLIWLHYAHFCSVLKFICFVSTAYISSCYCAEFREDNAMMGLADLS